VSAALVVEYFLQLPERRDAESPEDWRLRLRAAGEAFRESVAERYDEGTLVRLVKSGDTPARRAAVFALGMTTGMSVNTVLAVCLRDGDAEVRELAVDALWSVWFRAEGDDTCRDLRRIVRTRDREKARAALNKLIDRRPRFAEAYNQRAILSFRLKDFERAIADCEKVVELNPCHFGALAGLGQCYLQLRKHRAALKTFRAAVRLNPNLDSIVDTIKALESVLGEEGRRDDRKER
jgi:tetratricopeptide (TPR) repeat protein